MYFKDHCLHLKKNFSGLQMKIKENQPSVVFSAEHDKEHTGNNVRCGFQNREGWASRDDWVTVLNSLLTTISSSHTQTVLNSNLLLKNIHYTKTETLHNQSLSTQQNNAPNHRRYNNALPGFKGLNAKTLHLLQTINYIHFIDLKCLLKITLTISL